MTTQLLKGVLQIVGQLRHGVTIRTLRRAVGHAIHRRGRFRIFQGAAIGLSP